MQKKPEESPEKSSPERPSDSNSADGTSEKPSDVDTGEKPLTDNNNGKAPSVITLGMVKLNLEKMELKISGFEVIGKKSSRHVIYKIEGFDQHGTINVVRRFREFHYLH